MKERIDSLLVERGLAEDTGFAKRLLMAGIVLVDGKVVDKPAVKVPSESVIELKGQDCPFVSRGGLKLNKALETFCIDVTGGVFVDAGSSTGGFTDCLLSKGAARVVAIDVGYGQMAWRLRNDPRISLHERTNVRDATVGFLGMERPADGLVADLSFIGLTQVLETLQGLVREKGFLVLLVKPQFESGRDSVEKGGVVRDPRLIVAAAEEVARKAVDLGLAVKAIIPTGVDTPNGNVEMLLHAVKDGSGVLSVDFNALLTAVTNARRK